MATARGGRYATEPVPQPNRIRQLQQWRVRYGGQLMAVDSQIAVQRLHDRAERQLSDDVCRVGMVAAMQKPQSLAHDARPFDVQGVYVLAEQAVQRTEIDDARLAAQRAVDLQRPHEPAIAKCSTDVIARMLHS